MSVIKSLFNANKLTTLTETCNSLVNTVSKIWSVESGRLALPGGYTIEPNNWDIFSNGGMLLAVPKKKVSHQKKRQRLYAPGKKQLKFQHHLNRCPSCGHYKLANTLCTNCVQEIRHIWKTHTNKKVEDPIQEQELSELDRRLIYPGKKETEYEKKLNNKDKYLKRTIKTLPVENK
ncbi:hypothetical protein Kpol_1050p7 [Vanderwaltozyma polyspora DSM 70294]|uniref:Large ribosomal subunit protein bL32m n=1 Tax=Vanderwaltozyma polyspora (strain ATCC 22028 / DSM 70294 / BCRC 21397 / CBS 2163 / NBRC 10782 / NRRL Y-8283 / UCD 57-17) TaxID=436907 RepID=A7TEQ4_VANPO|nr:uncharacterized protein Kpol_1050p7 [Vanderwaltozyma polyspora DSM 70294]EDO19150.1 hypothetical protein Kpol_1050p7 [Vanderwaltozyma polyspora DSM 70294]